MSELAKLSIAEVPGLVFLPKYLLLNGNHYDLGAFTDLKLLSETIARVDPNPIYWKLSDETSSSYSRKCQISGFYNPRFHGVLSWQILGFAVNDTAAIERFEIVKGRH